MKASDNVVAFPTLKTQPKAAPLRADDPLMSTIEKRATEANDPFDVWTDDLVTADIWEDQPEV